MLSYLFFYLYKYHLRCICLVAIYLRIALFCALALAVICLHACVFALVSVVPARKDRLPAMLCMVHMNHRGVSEHWNVCDTDVFCETSHSVSSVPGCVVSSVCECSMFLFFHAKCLRHSRSRRRSACWPLRHGTSRRRVLRHVQRFKSCYLLLQTVRPCATSW